MLSDCTNIDTLYSALAAKILSWNYITLKFSHFI